MATLKNLAMSSGFRFKHIALRMDVHPTQLSHWIQGHRPMPYRHVDRFAEAIGVDPDMVWEALDHSGANVSV